MVGNESFQCLLSSPSKGKTAVRAIALDLQINYFPSFVLYFLPKVCCPIQKAFCWYVLNAFALSSKGFLFLWQWCLKWRDPTHLVIEHTASITDGCDCCQPRSFMKYWCQMVRDSIFKSKIHVRCSGFTHMVEHSLIGLTGLF